LLQTALQLLQVLEAVAWQAALGKPLWLAPGGNPAADGTVRGGVSDAREPGVRPRADGGRRP
jgi:hypothetical protein